MIARAVLISMLLAVATTASAQESDVQAAAAAFGEAQRAQLRGDFGQAADLFEIADRAAPSPAALRSAIRNHRAAGQSARAATLSAEAATRYPDDAETSALASETLSTLAPSLGHVSVRCANECTVTLDGRALVAHAITSYEIYVDPGAHAIVGSWRGTGVDRQSFEAHAGEAIALELVAPVVEAQPEPEPVVAPVVAPEPEPAPPPPASSSSGVHPALFGTLTGLALVGLAITIWSGIDTLNGASEYRANPTHAGYDDGIARELRTNVLIGATSALGVAALISVFFTDWDDITPGPDERITLRPSFYGSADGGGITLRGGFAL